MPSFEGNLLIQQHQITSSETRDPRLPYGEVSISPGLESVPGRDGQILLHTEGFTLTYCLQRHDSIQ